MAETRIGVLPELAAEKPTTELILDLLPVQGGHLIFATSVAFVLSEIESGLADLEEGDLERIIGLSRCCYQELRERKVRGDAETDV